MTSDWHEELDSLSESQRRRLAEYFRRTGRFSCGTSQQMLRAYVVAAHGTSVESNDLRDWLKTQLPDAMIPQEIVLLREIPRLPNGKIDVARLPARSLETSDTRLRSPKTEVEKTLAAIWCELLGLSEVGLDDDFFEVGGDSIIGIRVLSRARQAGILLQPKDFADGATIAELSGAAERIGNIAEVVEEAEDHPENRRCLFRLDGIGNTIQYHLLDFTETSSPTFRELRTVRFDRDYSRSTRLEEMAADYLNQIRKIQPNGPYMFISMDCGAHVAYETAQQLFQSGEDVSFFGVCESTPPLRAPSVMTKYLLKGLRYLKRMDFRGFIQGIRLTQRRGILLKERNSTDPAKNRFEHGLTINNYIPRTYPGRITVFQSREYHQKNRGPENIRHWKSLAVVEPEVVILDGTIPLDIVSDTYKDHLLSRIPS